MKVRTASTNFFILVAFFCCGGCSGGKHQDNLRFKDTTETQHAVFLTRLGHDGGPGAADVFVKPHFRGKPKVNGRLVLLTHESLEQVKNRLSRSRPEGADYVLVEAKLHVEQLSGRVTTDPPSRQSYQGVVLEELVRVQWYSP